VKGLEGKRGKLEGKLLKMSGRPLKIFVVDVLKHRRYRFGIGFQKSLEENVWSDLSEDILCQAFSADDVAP
jgi:hypothetical protein